VRRKAAAIPTIPSGCSRPSQLRVSTADGIAKLTRREHLLRQDEHGCGREHKRSL
jgi:hypothetical protein